MKKHNIIWIASYPKSGNTWMASVLEVAGRGFGYPQGGYDAYHLQATKAQPQVCPAVIDDIATQPCSILKTHAMFRPEGLPHVFPDLQPVTAAFIHVYRNPLDVLLSYIGFTRIEYRLNADSKGYKDALFLELLGMPGHVDYDQWRTMGIDALERRHLDHALDSFSERGMGIPMLEPMAGTWLGHLRSWKEAAKVLPGKSLRYEDCLTDPGTFDQVADLFTFGPQQIRASVEFVNLRSRKSAQSGDERHRIFYNKMQAGYFREYFSPEAIDRFYSVHEEELKEAGYASLLERV